MAVPKILIVEDEEEIAFLLKKRLGEIGYTEVAYAPDGVQAVQLAHRLRPDLILLDILLPGGSGLNVLRKVKMSARTEKTPVIVITGSQTPGLKEQTLAAGACDYFQKPYEREKLFEKIRQTIGDAMPGETVSGGLTEEVSDETVLDNKDF